MTPRTAAGRALLDSFEFDDPEQEARVADAILAIEAEAAAPYRDALAALVAEIDVVGYGESVQKRNERIAKALAAARRLVES